MCPPELRDRIIVVAVAPFKYIDKELCKRVIHLVSKGDKIAYMDREGMEKNRDTIIFLDPHYDNTFDEHGIEGLTYSKGLVKILIEIFEGFN